MESFIKGNVAEVARQYNIHANLLSLWRKQFMEKGQLVFQPETADAEKHLKKKIERMENLIGKKEIEINILKRYLDFYAPQDGS